MHNLWQKFRMLTKIKKIVLLTFIFIFFSTIFWVNNNYNFYERPLAKIEKVEKIETEEVVDEHGNEDQIQYDRLVAEMKNGQFHGEKIELINKHSTSKAYDFNYKKNDVVFVKVQDKEGDLLTGAILDMKRDTYLVYAGWLFIIILISVGRKQGLYSIVSLIINASILSFALDFQMKALHIHLFWISLICVLLFTCVSLLLVNGFNEKSYTAMIVTFLGTAISLIITFIIFKITNEQGLRYEEMDYLTRTYRLVFMASLFIGSLGAVMDIGITIASSMFQMYTENNRISLERLKQSGRAVGEDIMGAMTNILFFAYISGTIPMLILYLKNNAPLGFTLQMNLTLELARALAGGIGIVLSIPIALYTSLYFIKRRKARL